jgi:hypothetical protein
LKTAKIIAVQYVYGFLSDTNYNKLLRDTPARQAEQDRIERLLSNHVISNDYGIQSYDLKEQCDHFLGVNS